MPPPNDILMISPFFATPHPAFSRSHGSLLGPLWEGLAFVFSHGHFPIGVKTGGDQSKNSFFVAAFSPPRSGGGNKPSFHFCWACSTVLAVHLCVSCLISRSLWKDKAFNGPGARTHAQGVSSLLGFLLIHIFGVSFLGSHYIPSLFLTWAVVGHTLGCRKGNGERREREIGVCLCCVVAMCAL